MGERTVPDHGLDVNDIIDGSGSKTVIPGVVLSIGVASGKYNFGRRVI